MSMSNIEFCGYNLSNTYFCIKLPDSRTHTSNIHQQAATCAHGGMIFTSKSHLSIPLSSPRAVVLHRANIWILKALANVQATVVIYLRICGLYGSIYTYTYYNIYLCIETNGQVNAYKHLVHIRYEHCTL